MQWRNSAGQAAVEAAVLIPLVALLLLAVVSAGMGAVAELLVVSSAGQGARQAAALCVPGGPAPGALESAEQAALSGLRPLSGPKLATASYAEPDVTVTVAYTFAPPLPGARLLLGDGVVLRRSAVYRCG